MNETKIKRPINRWIVVLLLIIIVVSWRLVPPISPKVSLKADPIIAHPLFTLPVIGDFYLTNTLLTSLIIDVILILLAFSIKRGLADEKKRSKGIIAVFELLVNTLNNMVESTAGKKWASFIFPVMASLIIVVLVSNLVKLIPGFETIGIIEPAAEGGYASKELLPGVYTITKTPVVSGQGYEIVPFFRSPSTDLNFTVALALTAVVLVQVIGVKANGLGYFTKFLNFGRFARMWGKKTLGPFDVINPFLDVFVGMLEFVSDFAKIISFSFRLLGSMFGGAVLVIILSALLPVVGFGLYFLELFFGVIQAIVFGFLTMVFMTVATQEHASHE